MLDLNQLTTLLTLQSEINTKVDATWQNGDAHFMRAKVIESANAMEYHGWNRLKTPFRHTPNFCAGLVEIAHLTFSHLLVQAGGQTVVAAQMLQEQLADQAASVKFDGKEYFFSECETMARLELLIGLSVSRRICIPLFKTLMDDCEMDWENFFRASIAKNLLSLFRMDFGHKNGTYIKVWDGRDDVDHMSELMMNTDITHPTIAVSLYTALAVRYPRERMMKGK